ncbi:DnaJ family domain-containing protein [Salsuginibacillus kocurii]|uniref:DnaJ family domain-containing protein n=1 Tax=Salsuginibacillus kocurii TaxID=427078 RepID=UPI00037BE321|nr:DnaJ family domain-containing protein [Salsuginibacillus kocurii]
MSDRTNKRFESSYQQFEKERNEHDLPGKGKPLSDKFLKEDALSGIVKQANYTPPWIEVQQEIGREMARVVKRMEAGAAVASDIEVINEHIRTYNRMCPSPSMQRGLVSQDTIKQKVEHWR